MFLSERQLAMQLEMSKTPVHVALERLESEGFVTISAQQGIVVRGLSVEDIVDLYELREAMESYVAGRLAGRLTEAQRAELEGSIEQQEKALEEGDVGKMIELDARFHLLLASFLGNKQIIATMEHLRDKIHQVIVRVTRLNPQRLRESVDEHREIAGAIVKGDAALAAKRVLAHLEAGKRHVLNPTRFPV
jgi:DNA-binding GntR family transcriptional regulator